MTFDFSFGNITDALKDGSKEITLAEAMADGMTEVGAFACSL